MMSRKNLLAPIVAVAVAVGSVVASSAFAGDAGIAITPIIGYERVQKILPTPHSTDRLIYGARAAAGIPALSAEAEYTRGQDSEDFPTLGQSTKDLDEALKVGARSEYRLGSFIGIFVRGGVEARRNHHEATSGGVTTVTDNPTVYHPYAGAGLNAYLGRTFVFNAGLTAIFHAFPDMSQNDYQAEAGFTVRFP